MKDLIILGNGMAGMTAALYAKRANLDFEIIGKNEFDFGQIGDAILVDNYPCAAGLTGFDLAMKLHDQLEDNDIQIKEDELKEIHPHRGEYKIMCEKGIYIAKSVIYALGAKHRELNCEIDESVDIHYCALCDGALYRNKRVVVIGGGDAAFTQAEYLSRICKEVTILMCDRNVTAAPITFERVSKISNIKILYDCPVESIHTMMIESTNVYRIGLNGKRGFIIVDGIFVAIGMIPNTNYMTNFGNKIFDKNGYIKTNEECETEWGGFFAAGDIRQKRVRQSITAAADGAIAVQSAIEYLKR